MADIFLSLSRFARYNNDAAGQPYRNLFKVYGIRFDILVNGKVRETIYWKLLKIPLIRVIVNNINMVFMCFLGWKIQYHSYSDQYWLWTCFNGCCEYKLDTDGV